MLMFLPKRTFRHQRDLVMTLFAHAVRFSGAPIAMIAVAVLEYSTHASLRRCRHHLPHCAQTCMYFANRLPHPPALAQKADAKQGDCGGKAEDFRRLARWTVIDADYHRPGRRRALYRHR